MTAETIFLNRAVRPGFRDLDVVVLLGPATTVTGATVAAGTEGTVVGILEPGQAYVVEFPEPEGTLATVPAARLAPARQVAR